MKALSIRAGRRVHYVHETLGSERYEGRVERVLTSDGIRMVRVTWRAKNTIPFTTTCFLHEVRTY